LKDARTASAECQAQTCVASPSALKHPSRSVPSSARPSAALAVGDVWCRLQACIFFSRRRAQLAYWCRSRPTVSTGRATSAMFISAYNFLLHSGGITGTVCCWLVQQPTSWTSCVPSTTRTETSPSSDMVRSTLSEAATAGQCALLQALWFLRKHTTGARHGPPSAC